MSDIRAAQLGMIGLGQMGLGMARNLLKAGFRVMGFDPRSDACSALLAAGGTVAADNPALVNACNVVMTSLVSSVYENLAHEVLLPMAKPGQVFIDMSTIPAPRTRILAKEFAAKGALALDAPVTGGTGGAAKGQLRMFVGGDQGAYQYCLPALQAVCQADGVTYGGEAGKGQVLKVVQQLKNRITDAVRMEVIAFGVRAGLSLNLVRRALDVSKGGSDPYESLLASIEAGKGNDCDVVFAEWAYYLEEAAAQGIPMPALESLYHFCKDGDKVCGDGVGRMAPSVWRELTIKPGPAWPKT